MPTSRPATRHIAELRRAAHREIDQLFDAWPTIIDAGRTIGGSRRPACDADMIRGQGDTNDPTHKQAMNVTAASSWRRDFVRLCSALETLAARAVDIVGELPENCCPTCRHYLDDGRPLHKANGRTLHRACYDRQRFTAGERAS